MSVFAVRPHGRIAVEFGQKTISKPPSAFWLWLQENRGIIGANAGSKSSEITRKGAEMWQHVPSAMRAPYEAKAAAQKEEYEKFIATADGQKALQEKKAANAEQKAEKNKKRQERQKKKKERDCKAALKSIEKGDSLKKAQSGYRFWLIDNRDKIAKEFGTGKGSDSWKKAAEIWKTISTAEKKPYEQKAAEQNAAYDRIKQEKKHIEKAEKLAEKEQKKQSREKQQIEKAEKLLAEKELRKRARLKPRSVYWLWLTDNRDKIAKEVGNGKLGLRNISEFNMKAGEIWRTISAAEKQPYEQKAAEQKAEYDSYIASEEGAAALEAFKDATQNTKDQFKPKDFPDEAEAGDDKKRKADVAEHGEVAVKKARGRSVVVGA